MKINENCKCRKTIENLRKTNAFLEPNFKNQLKPKENLRKINENIKNILKT